MTTHTEYLDQWREAIIACEARAATGAGCDAANTSSRSAGAEHDDLRAS